VAGTAALAAIAQKVAGNAMLAAAACTLLLLLLL
jgi:hypothetical protein